MKKAFLPFAALLLLAMSVGSCSKQKTYEAKDVELADELDSVNYFFGFGNGAEIRSRFLPTDSDHVKAQQMLSLADKLFEEADKPAFETYCFGWFYERMQIMDLQKNGLYGNPEMKINTNLYLQGLTNMIMEQNSEFNESENSRAIEGIISALRADTAFKAADLKANGHKYDYKVATVSLDTKLDSLSYMIGLASGYNHKQQFAANPAEDAEKRLLDGIRDGMEQEIDGELDQEFLMANEFAVRIAQTYDQFEKGGLADDKRMPFDNGLFRQGMINGLLLDVDSAAKASQESWVIFSDLSARIQSRDGRAFLLKNANEDGVVQLASGLQYKVITEGQGEIPADTSVVSVNYEGRLLDGTVFDSSEKHGGSVEFPVNQVIPGWTEALQLMPVGSKWQLYVPSELGYGSRPTPNIPANSTLIFDVELLGIVK